LSLTFVLINTATIGVLVYAFFKDRSKALQALKIGLRALLLMLPVILTMIIFIGLLLSFLPHEKIGELIGEQSGLGGVLITGFFGAILHIPSLIAFPMAASMLKAGAAITAVAAFITTLTMIGIVTLPVEIKELGAKFALYRNGISFIMAIIIALIMGVIL